MDDEFTGAANAKKESPFLTTGQAASYVGYSPRTLEGMRRTGRGPAFRRHGRCVRYHMAELDAWLESRPRSAPPDA